MTRISTTLAALAIGAFAAQAQNPLSTELKGAYTRVKTNTIKAAEKMPDDQYVFKATADVQNFGQRIAHVADANMGTCARLKGEQKSVGAGKMTTKADIVGALKESFAYCDAVVDGMTDADMTGMVAGRGGAQNSRLSVLYGMVAHDNEMYGYISVYMRLKGVIPPSSEPRQ